MADDHNCHLRGAPSEIGRMHRIVGLPKNTLNLLLLVDILSVSFDIDLVRCSFVSLHQWSQFNQTAACCICILMGKFLAISLAKLFEQLEMQLLLRASS